MPQPPGYLQVQHPRAELVAAESVVAPLGEVLDRKTLYAWAATHPKRRPYAGRITAYGVPLPNGTDRVVVRHSHHGGLLARFTQDRFLPPTRAPQELEASVRLAEAGIPTPRVVAYAIYPAGRFFRRSDVVTEEIAPARDLGVALKEARDPAARRDLQILIAPLLSALAGVGDGTHDDVVRRLARIGAQHTSGERAVRRVENGHARGEHRRVRGRARRDLRADAAGIADRDGYPRQ